MMKFLNTIFLLVLSLSYLPTVKAEKSVFNQAKIDKIFDNLVNAVGDNSHALPQVVIRPEKRFGASYRRSENTIFIDQAAIDVCTTLGGQAEAAIAFLLGHELTHYYQKHDWKEAGFATSFITSQAIFQEHIHHESEADTYAAFISHLAGYQTLEVIPIILEKIYVAYDLKSKELTSYPSLAQRKEVANKVCKTVQGLIHIYEAGNYLFALGKYDEALASYEYLLQYVKFKELYNNIGLCAMYAALPNSKRDFAFFYPLSLDTSFPLRAPSGITREELLEKAITAFATATNYDAAYFTSFLNLLCAYDLASQTTKALHLLDKVKNLATTARQQQQLAIIEGILVFNIGNKNKAIELFEQVQQLPKFPALANLAQQNLKIVQGEQINLPITRAIRPRLKDKIEAINLLFYKQDANAYVLKQTNFDKKIIAIESLPKSIIYSFSSNERVTKIQLTTSQLLKTATNVGVGSTYEMVKAHYKNSLQNKITHLNGFYLLLPKEGLLFNCNLKNEVIQWGVFID